MSGLSKITIERNTKTLLELVAQPGNDTCADCKSRNPRWASHNLGIFLCVNCASIHRKIGTHVTKVKSITMDAWTKEQVESMRLIGNVKSNSTYNPNESRNPLPPTLMDAERDSELEQYIRSKYQFKRFLSKPPPKASMLNSSQSSSSMSSSGSTPRSVSSPLTSTRSMTQSTSSSSSLSAGQRPPRPSTVAASAPSGSRSFSQPFLAASQSQQQQHSYPTAQPQQRTQPTTRSQHQVTNNTNAATTAPGGLWADLVSLQTPSTSSSLPLQYHVPSQTQTPLSVSTGFTNGAISSYQQQTTPTSMGVNPYQQQHIVANPYSQQQQTYQSPGMQIQSSSPSIQQQPFSAASFAQQQQPSVSVQSPFSAQAFSQVQAPQQQQYFTTHSQLQPQTAQEQNFYQPQPQQQPFQSQSQFNTQAQGQGGAGFMSAPATQAQFLSSSPIQQQQQFHSQSHSPQAPPQSMTPQPQLQSQLGGQFGGQFGGMQENSMLQPQQQQQAMGMGMGMQGQFTPASYAQLSGQQPSMYGAQQQQPQQMTMGTGMGMGMMQTPPAHTQFGGQPFSSGQGVFNGGGGYNGGQQQQWGGGM